MADHEDSASVEDLVKEADEALNRVLQPWRDSFRALMMCFAMGKTEEAEKFLNYIQDATGIDARPGMWGWIENKPNRPIPKILYHHTDIRNLPLIEKLGLRPWRLINEPRDWCISDHALRNKEHSAHEMTVAYYKNVSKYLWLTEIPYRRIPKAFMLPQDATKLVRFEVDTTFINLKRIHPQKDVTYVTESIVHPSSIISVCLVDNRNGYITRIPFCGVSNTYEILSNAV